MPIAYYITHPQVQVDASIPVPEWGLSDIGRARVSAMLDRSWVGSIRRIVSSGERKAIETAEILARHLRLAVEVWERMHENDRSATGFLPPLEFEAVADRFFASPHKSIRGWERAVDAQSRIVIEVETALATNDGNDIAFFGHEAWEHSCCFISPDGRSAAKQINPRAAATISPTISTRDGSSMDGYGSTGRRLNVAEFSGSPAPRRTGRARRPCAR